MTTDYCQQTNDLGGGISIPKIPIARVHLDQRELLAVQQVLQSGHLRAGRVAEDFEKRFANVVGARFAVAVSSGTAALFLAYRVMLEPGDEVIVPDFTFVATAAMATAIGARPVFADVDPETFALDPADVERKITRRTRAIVPVHLFGHPAKILRLLQIARRHQLRVIWDAAQAHGARSNGRDVGSFPDVACYSFYPTKNMTTAEGGMLTTSDPSLATEFELLRSHGEQGRYTHVRIGFNFRLTDIAAALGRAQLAKLPISIRKRRRNAAFLAHGLLNLPGVVSPIVASGVEHSFNQFTIRVDPEVVGMSRDEFQRALSRCGIESAVHYPLPLHRQPIFPGQGSDAEFPVSTRLAQTVLSLPVHPKLTRADLKRIVRAVRDIAKSR